MTTSTDERDRILNLVELGHITAVEAAQLLDAIVVGHGPERQRPSERNQNRMIRVWMSDLATTRKSINVTATMPLSLIKVTLRLLAHLAPQFSDETMQDVIRALETGPTGRLLDMQDMEEGKRIEIFVE
jgi:polyhydroxyalkanoate synthesis regulator phasin